MSNTFMVTVAFVVRRHIQWVFQALELGCSGVHTGIERGLGSSLSAEIEHLDQLPRAWVTRQGSRLVSAGPVLCYTYICLL